MSKDLPERNKECWKAELDMYCDDLIKGKKLTKDTLSLIKKVFVKFPDLKEEFPALESKICKGK